ncbi:MAG: DNA topoisomerase IB (poxvirus type) [uncultured Nocardioidaceae bacterium]|uniref:DNA topoisomerase n=1 Tax=uncultured Nocardioidaceae bacterium TaxID=253824 RepID=A0A6J4MH19_9ACTN|nr:MAG: DNA topoisomerase IB (poxvirus type) [uncultured Nocardioidaceae bacterium]
MPRLRTVSPNDVGWTRQRAGRGFAYLDIDGRRLDGEHRERCKQLVIPPAWRDVWICPHPTGHIQAVGTDDAGRRQYLYHPLWRRLRDQAKHDRVLEVADELPSARKVVAEHIVLPGMPRERVLATAFRLLDLGFFRVGGESYTEQNGSFGLATLRKEHVRISRGVVVFEFTAKSSKEQHVEITDPDVRSVLTTLRRRRDGGEELLAYRAGRTWVDVSSDDVNGYVKTLIGCDVSAKDFRTWHGTVMAAIALAERSDSADNKTARKRAVAAAMREVADGLGNTPTVARASYVDPRVIDLFEDGVTIEPTLRELGERPDPTDVDARQRLEAAVLQLLRTPPEALGRSRRTRRPRADGAVLTPR